MKFPFLDGGGPFIGGRVPATGAFKKGTRRDVGRLLEGSGVMPFGDAFQLLAHAWHADVELSRFPSHQDAALTSREVQALISDLSVNQPGFAGCINPATLAELYLIGEQHVVKGIVTALRHPRASCRQKAAQLCDAIGDPRWLDYFAGIDDTDPPEAVSASLRTFCRLGDERHLAKLQQALAHPDEAVSTEALKSIARLEPAAALTMLDTAANNGRPVVCVSALVALGDLGDLALMPRLVAELDSEKSFHRIGAARGLAALAVRCPHGDFTGVMAALQLKVAKGGLEYRHALEAIREAVGIHPELPIPARGGEHQAETLPIPDRHEGVALFEPKSAGPPFRKPAELDENDHGSRPLPE